MARVLNRREVGIPLGAVYVGRPTKWGNPFRLPCAGPLSHTLRSVEEMEYREAAIEKYRQWLLAQPKLVEAAKQELKGKDLVCWCAPLPCHADVLLAVANGAGKEIPGSNPVDFVHSKAAFVLLRLAFAGGAG